MVSVVVIDPPLAANPYTAPAPIGIKFWKFGTLNVVEPSPEPKLIPNIANKPE